MERRQKISQSCKQAWLANPQRREQQRERCKVAYLPSEQAAVVPSGISLSAVRHCHYELAGPPSLCCEVIVTCIGNRQVHPACCFKGPLHAMQGMNFRFSLHRAVGRMRMHVQAAAEGFAPCQVSSCACDVLCSGPQSLAPMHWPPCMLHTVGTLCAPAGAWLGWSSTAHSLLRVTLMHDVQLNRAGALLGCLLGSLLHKPQLRIGMCALQELKPHRNRGKPKSAEHRAKISDSQRKRHAARKQELQAVHPGALESSAPPVPETEPLSLPADLKPEIQEALSSDGEQGFTRALHIGVLLAFAARSRTASHCVAREGLGTELHPLTPCICVCVSAALYTGLLPRLCTLT